MSNRITPFLCLDGHPFVALNGGPQCRFTEAVSFVVNCTDQQEVDYYWDRLLAGGTPQQCGWLKDRFGLPWQIVPTSVIDMLKAREPATSQRVMATVMQMIKIDIAQARQAYEQG